MRRSSNSTAESQTSDSRPSSSGSARTDDPRPSSRGVYRRLPCPPTRSPIKPATASPIMRTSSVPELPITTSTTQRTTAQHLGMDHVSVVHSYNTDNPRSLLHTLGGASAPIAPDGPLEPWMEMSTMVESPPVAWGFASGAGSVYGWNGELNSQTSDSSDTSRPNSACSGSSFNSSNGSTS